MAAAADVVKTFRGLRGLTTRALATAAGVPETTIRRIEKGQAPTLPALVALLDALEVDERTRVDLIRGVE